MTNLKPFRAAFFWLLVVTGLSVLPSVQLPKFELFAADKLGHAGVYAVLSWLILLGIQRSEERLPARHEMWATFAFSTFYGVLMEFVQGTFIPGRFYELDDMIANAFGAALAWAGWALLRQRRFY
jgi:VanZ family protein